MRSPLELNTVLLESLEIRISDPLPMPDQVTENYTAKIDYTTARIPDKAEHAVTLSVSFTPEAEAVCRFRKVAARLTGYFFVPDDIDPDLLSKLMPVNCLAILYGIVRGMVAQSTGMSPGGSFIMPPVNFIAMVEARKKPRPRKATSAA